MMTVLLPAITAALFVVARTYQGECDAVQRSLRDSALGIAISQLLSQAPEGDPDPALMHAWASHTGRQPRP